MLLIGLASAALQVWVWRRLRRRVLSCAMTKLAALFEYAAWALAPLIAFVVLFLGAMGAEELTGAAVIPEPFGRAALLVGAMLLGTAALGWVIFLVLCVFVWRVPAAKA